MMAVESDPAQDALTDALRSSARHITAGEYRRAAVMLEELAAAGFVLTYAPQAVANAQGCTPEPEDWSPSAECVAAGDHQAEDCPDLEADGYAWPDVTGSLPASVALEAHEAVYGDRGEDYGHPRVHWTRTAIIWTGLLQHKLEDGEYITPEDVGRLYIGDKLSRDVHSPKRDNRVDMAGYAICLDRLETGQ